MHNTRITGAKAGLVFMMLVFAGSSALAREKVLYRFPGGDGAYDSRSGVVFDSSGNLYGATSQGGTYGWGTIYELTPFKRDWRPQLLYSFLGAMDGANPVGNLLIDSAGNLYGTTQGGGTGGGGTIFELQKSQGSWTHLVLYNFCSLSNCSDGRTPNGLTVDTGGNLYGTTESGGGQSCRYNGCGTVYELSPSNGSWTETVLHAFESERGDGYFPAPGVTLGQAGTLYGTTSEGGGYGAGTVFELKSGKRGWSEVRLFDFDGLPNYGDPNGFLTLDSAGNLFGATRGSNECGSQCGSIFRLSRSRGQWVERNVYTFAGTDGAGPNPGLILDSAGNFYGSTIGGGAYGFGEVFKLKPGKTWTITLLYSFTGSEGDESPNPGLVFGPGGNLYGTVPATYNRGDYDGEVFEILK